MRRPIAIFIPFSFGRGVERVGVTLARALASRGLDVDVVVGRSKGPYFAELDGKVRLVDLAAGRTLATLLPLARYLSSTRPRALLSAPDSASVIALWARNLARLDIRIITVTHAVLSGSLKRKPVFYRHAFPRLLRRMYARADAVVAVSQAVADDLAQMTGLRRACIQVVPNPVVHDDLLTQAREPIAHPWLQDRAVPVILGVGRLNEEKNYGHLIRAFACLRRGRPARLVILGEGVEMERLARLAAELGVADDICFPGFVANPYAYMARARILALTSHYEALPTVAIEALACGCPIVATDCPGGIREILDAGRFGRLVPVGALEALTNAMSATLDDPPESKLLQRRAMDFHVDKVVEKYLSMLDA